MAKLSMSIGALVAEIEMDDADAATLVAEYVAAYRGPVEGTPRRRLRWFVRHLGQHVEAVAGEQAAAAADAERERVREARKAMKFIQQQEAGE